MEDFRIIGLTAYIQKLEFKYDILKDALENLYIMTQNSKSGEGMHLHAVVKRALSGVKEDENAQ